MRRSTSRQIRQRTPTSARLSKAGAASGGWHGTFAGGSSIAYRRAQCTPGEIYNPAPLRLGSHAIVSQGAYVCGATHDFESPAFPLLAYSMVIGPYAWICARASIGPGVNVGEGAVLGMGSVATRDLEPWGVYAGVPAVKVKERKNTIAGAAIPAQRQAN